MRGIRSFLRYRFENDLIFRRKGIQYLRYSNKFIMRNSLLNLIKQTIVFKYSLPNHEKSFSKVNVSTHDDKCYSASDLESLKEIIYNSVIEYSFNEFDLKPEDYANLYTRALQQKIKYNESATVATQKKYGFFGEVLLYSMLQVLFDSPPLISRGYFYSPLENSETKGYDSYHLVERDDEVELWFGEAKFHQNYKSGIDDIFGKKDSSKGLSAGWKIEKALSDNYLNKNIITISSRKNDFNISNSTIEEMVSTWEETPNINIAEELNKYNAKLVYPVLVLYEGNIDYDKSIKDALEYINDSYGSISASLSLDYSLFFIFLPLQEVGQIKSDIISWIESKKQLLS